MSRHIDADVLSKAVYQSKNNNRHSGTILRLSHDNEHRHFLAMIDAAPTVDVSPDTKWISVKERLPENKGRYIIYVHGPEPFVSWFDGYRFRTIGIAPFVYPATHWMALPEPPKEEGENT